MELLLKVFLFYAVILGYVSSEEAESAEHIQCTSPQGGYFVQDDERLRETCDLTAFSAKQYKCWLAPGMICEGKVRPGVSSSCLDTVSKKVFKCQRGLWTAFGIGTDVDRVGRVKRGWWRRTMCWLGWSRRCGPKPNHKPDFTYCPPSQSVTADRGTLQKKVEWKQPTAGDPDGGHPSVSPISGYESGSTFDEGPTTVTYKVRDSGGLVEYCTFIVQVTVTSCQSGFQFLQQGTQTCSGPRYNIYGSECRHTCNQGYTLVGNRVVTCEANGQWSSSFPRCQPVSCGAPGSVTGGQVVCPNGHVFPQICSVVCDSGYRHTGSTYITCQANGAWTSLAPCKDVGGPKFPNGCPANRNLYSGKLESGVTVTWTNPSVTDNSGQTVSLTSSHSSGSLFLPGFHTVRISATDSSGNTARCNFVITVQVTICHSGFQFLQHGTQTCSGARYNIYGSECKHTCHQGYTLVGDRVVTCEANGQWSSSFPSCQPASCGAPGSVMGGHVVCPNGHVFPQICSVVCDSGYKHTGSTYITCQANGAWTSLAPCKDVEAPKFRNGCPANRKPYSGPLESGVTVTWTNPSVTDNSGQAVSLTSSHSSGSLFLPGSHIVRISATDSSGNTAHCNFVITVQVRSCSAWASPSNSDMSCSMGIVEGSECQVTCNPGYQLQGKGTLRCLSTKHWDSTFPSCQAITCSSPPAVSHGSFVCFGALQFKSVCTLTCDVGFTAQTPLMIQCLGSGSWSTPGSCLDTKPPEYLNSPCHLNEEEYASRLGFDTFVSFTNPPVTDNSGGHVVLVSDHTSGSSFPIGPTTVTYTATDSEGNRRVCQFTVTVTSLTCSKPDLEPAHRTNSLMTYNCPDGYVYGATCSLSCSYGFSLVGSNNITCERDDSTSPPTMDWDWPDPQLGKPECSAITCGSPPVVGHGSFVCSGGLQFKSVCTLTCDAGFTAQTPLMVQCQGNSSWSAPGSCLDTEPPEYLNSPCHLNEEEYASRLGYDTYVNFTDPPVTDNSGGHVVLVSDHTSGSSFPIGPTTVTYTATDSEGNSRVCQFTVTVTSLTCSKPDLEPAHRTKSLIMYNCPDGYVYGATCSLSCSYGFPLVGSDNITCERDDSTSPPTMDWEWPDPQLGKPTCLENNCTQLDPPMNGALACNLGNFGWDCLMSCYASFDIPAVTDGHFYCTNSDNYWRPSKVPDCIVRLLPGRVRLMADVFYFSGSCQNDLDMIRQNFIDRLSNSMWKDACINVPTCVATNVQIFCGPLSPAGRKRRSVSALPGVHRIGKRSTSHYYKVSFDIYMDYTENAKTKEEAFQDYAAVGVSLYNTLFREANEGHFNIGGLTTNGYSVQYPSLSVDCPPGTLYDASIHTSSFSCMGCSKGSYLANLTTGCLECPIGFYTEVDDATSCTPCPPGWSTWTTGSQNESQCVEMCPAGHSSTNGFVPCQHCPPGQYQSLIGATVCDHCPAGSWTDSVGSTSLDQCVAADVLLFHESLTAQVADSWTALDVNSWLSLSPDSSATVSVSFSPNTVLSVFVYTDGFDVSQVPQTSATAISRHVVTDTWFQLLWSLQPSTSAVTASYQSTTLLTFTPTVDITGSVVTLNISTKNLGVWVSSIWAQDSSSSGTTATVSTASCLGNNSNNIMQWNPSPSSLFLPSQCDAIDECLSSPCGNHGVCHNEMGSFWCHCTDGWSGTMCQVPPDTCYQHQCQNGATCVPSTPNYTCTCDADHSGSLCELEKVHGGWGAWQPWSDCSATCGGQRLRQRLCENPSPMNGGDTCLGSDTETEVCGDNTCPAVDECSSSPCGNHGVCHNEMGSFWCHCTDGWSGTTCQIPPDTCYQHQCQNGATCVPSTTNYTCTCDADHSGSLCELEKVTVHGGYGAWQTWSDCSATCGGQRLRQRLCNNPLPMNGGDNCPGSDTETEACGSNTCPVDGGWSQWGLWTNCTASCGGGEHTRQRSCDNPSPANGGDDCEGVDEEIEACNTNACPVHGGWSSWSNLTDCTVTCGNGTQTRERLCDNPVPAQGGNPCSGASNETLTCNLGQCPVDGGWSQWGLWRNCTASCGGGERTRQRSCDNPSPANGGDDCEGVDEEIEACNTNGCPVHGGWSSWSNLTDCSVTCGNGTQTRERLCDNPVPAQGGNPCSGASNETLTCNLQKCPECSQLHNPLGAYLNCSETTSPFLRTCDLNCLPGFMSTVTFPTYRCGEDTGYLWNHQRDHESSAPLPTCSRAFTINSVTILQSVPMDTGCDASTRSSVTSQIQNNINVYLPCTVQGLCTTSVSAQCSSSKRGKRSTPNLVVDLQTTLDFGTSSMYNDSNAEKSSSYQQLVSVAQQTFSAITNNGSNSIFKATVNGQTVNAQMNESATSASAYCPAGSTVLDVFCAECPAGTKEENGECELCPLGQYQDQKASTDCKDCPAGFAWDLEGATNISQCLYPYNATLNRGTGTSDEDNFVLIIGVVLGVVALITVAIIIIMAVVKFQPWHAEYEVSVPLNAALQCHSTTSITGSEGRQATLAGIELVDIEKKD